MRKLIILIFFILFSVVAPAQDDNMTSNTAPELKFKSELGLISGGGQGYTGEVHVFGLQYTRWKNDHRAHRLFVSYGISYEGDHREFAYNYDTLFETLYGYRWDMLVIGGAIQEQRRLFKRTYLFAALEGRIGLGTTEQDIVIRAFYTGKKNWEEITDRRFGNNDGKVFYIAFLPALGVKWEFWRMSAGIEALMHLAAFNVKQDKTGSVARFDIAVLHFQERLFLNYRF